MRYIIKQVFFLLSFFFLFFFIFPQATLADNYGAGNYGSGVYSANSNSNSNSPSNTVGAPVCTAASPTTAPWLYGAITKSDSTVLLYFTDITNNVDRYVLEFGTKSGYYQYSSPNIGGANARTYLVQNLSSSTKYYFRVRAGNGCATGPWSDEISSSTFPIFASNQLDITSSQLTPVVNQQASTSSGTKPIINNPTVTSGYKVNVFVKDISNLPVEGASVTMHSDPQTAKTDKNGVATFNNIPAGQHEVLIAYNNFQGKETISLTGDVKEFNLNVTMKPVNIWLSSQMIIVIVVSIFIVLALLVVVVRMRKKK